MIQRERAEGAALMQLTAGAWWRPYLTHIPNERSSAIEAKILSGQGVSPGVPDYLLFLRRGPYTGCAIELKAAKPHGRQPSDSQQEWLCRLVDQGWHTDVCFGFDQAWATLNWYVRQAPYA